mmetsp:Transcript_17858/g.31370  ORF Transcript_17858/g.31370 Transcript_17858/m.31370 type:complete len:386 (-) Transcript_17858:572-1729(-)
MPPSVHSFVIILLIIFAATLARQLGQPFAAPVKSNYLPGEAELPAEDQRGDAPFAAGAGRAPHAPHVLGRVPGEVEQHHVVHLGLFKVHPSRGAVCADQNHRVEAVAAHESTQVLAALLRLDGVVVGQEDVLVAALVQPPQRVLHLPAVLDGVAEHQRAVRAHGERQLGQRRPLVREPGLLGLLLPLGPAAVDDHLLEVGRDLVQAGANNLLHVRKLPGHLVGHLPRERGGDEDELGGPGGPRPHGAQVEGLVQEEHVHLVQHRRPQRLQGQHLPLEEVGHAARGRDQQVHRVLLQQPHLLLEVGGAGDAHAAQRAGRRQPLGHQVHLGGQLGRGREHQHPRGPRPRPAPRVRHLLGSQTFYQWQQISQGFSTPCLICNYCSVAS